MTHNELCLLATRFIKRNGYKFAISEMRSATDEIPDAIGFKCGSSMLVECKVSVSDFKADAKKPYRIKQELGMGNYRYYLCPEGLIKPDYLPKGWGLIYEKKGRLKQIIGSSHFETNYQAERGFLYTILSRSQNNTASLHSTAE